MAKVDDATKLEIVRYMRDLERRLLAGKPVWREVNQQLVAIAEGRAPGQMPGERKRDMAEENRVCFEQYYHSHGFSTLSVPKPNVSNHEFARREKLGQAPFYRPASSEATYVDFMIANGQGDHWTVVHEDRKKIAWETTDHGYWFWAEVNPSCPCLRTPWNTLSTTIHLLSLEEYVIVWHFLKTNGVVLDLNTWSWLRTRYEGSGALSANEGDGQVDVCGNSSENLSEACGSNGGRLVEVVKN